MLNIMLLKIMTLKHRINYLIAERSGHEFALGN